MIMKLSKKLKFFTRDEATVFSFTVSSVLYNHFLHIPPHVLDNSKNRPY